MKICKNENCETKVLGPNNKLYCSQWCRDNQNRREYKRRNKEQWTIYQRVRRNLQAVEHLLLRDNCLLCGEIDTPTLQIHHVIKVQLGGDNSLSNLMVLCTSCHAKWHRFVEPVLLPLLSDKVLSKPGFRTGPGRT